VWLVHISLLLVGWDPLCSKTVAQSLENDVERPNEGAHDRVAKSSKVLQK